MASSESADVDNQIAAGTEIVVVGDASAREAMRRSVSPQDDGTFDGWTATKSIFPFLECPSQRTTS